jgi:hypothetical protein
MLTIKNIKELELNFCYQRGLKRITETTNALGEHFYCFNFGPISDGNGFNKETEVRLGRDINQGEYIFHYKVRTASCKHYHHHKVLKNKPRKTKSSCEATLIKDTMQVYLFFNRIRHIRIP